ncbi:IclR family transcriptional regulator [Devosia sp.]|uniref:IclR family transcriptional regulator n=1 Tax=Devosia sp. TaxID=1871048 RepID=UPI003A8ECD76
MSDPHDADRYRAPALDKGLDILELLADSDAGLSQAEIAKALGRSANEIYRMLDRLVRRRYVRRTPADRYEVTLKLFELAHARPPLGRMVNAAMPAMRSFARDTRQACHLSVYDRGALIVVAQVDAPDYWNVSIRTGARFSLTGTGSGLVLLAHTPAEERRLILAEQQPAQTLDDAVAAELQTILAQGYGDVPSRQIAGVRNLAVPVLGPMGRVLAVFACPYTERLDSLDAPSRQATRQALIAASATISERQAREEG